MLGLASPKLIKSRQEAATYITFGNHTGHNSVDIAINPVKLGRAYLRNLSVYDINTGTISPYCYFTLAFELVDATTVRVHATVSAMSGNGPWTVYVKCEVIELGYRPKSLQSVTADGTTSQIISPVDPTKACLILASFECRNLGGYYPTLGASSVTWASAPNVLPSLAFRYWVLEP